MAIKELALVCSVMGIFIVSSNILGVEAKALDSMLDSYYENVKNDLIDLQQCQLDLLNDMQMVYDLQKEYIAGNVDFTEVQKGKSDLIATRAQCRQKAMQYETDSKQYDALLSLTNSQITNPYIGV